MASAQIMRYCRKCGKQTMHVGHGTSHLLHLILATISAGVWVPVWIFIHLNNATKMACSQCGRKRGLLG